MGIADSGYSQFFCQLIFYTNKFMNKLQDYIELSSFNKNTALVQLDKCLYVKKRVSKSLVNTYRCLINNKHKNISNIVEIYEQEDSLTVITEYINGETLSDILKKQGTLSESETKNIIGQISDGLIFLHKLNIIHRDINPNNIMITNDGIVKIIDFDISRSVKKSASNDTAVLGTVGYAAPEQFGFAQSDSRTDIYALGVLANVMLTGEIPGLKQYDGKLGKVIKKATMIDADIRYKSVAQFKTAFTNEVDENTNKFIKALRHIPGFRTWEGYKIIIALFFYSLYIPLMIVFLTWSFVNINTVIMTVISEVLLFVLPYLLLTNLFNVRRFLARRRGIALLIAVLISIISFMLGAVMLITTIGKQL